MGAHRASLVDGADILVVFVGLALFGCAFDVAPKLGEEVPRDAQRQQGNRDADVSEMGAVSDSSMARDVQVDAYVDAEPGRADALTDAAMAPPPSACGDGVDNDGDGLTDLWDPGCSSAQDDLEDDDERGACANGVDDDGNGFIDFPYDPGCGAQGDPDESELAEPAVCANGIDDDFDGLIDYPLDPGCSGRGSASELENANIPACANGIDDDQDGVIDFPDDPSCASASYFSEVDSCEQVAGATPLSLGDSGVAAVPVPQGGRINTVATSCQTTDLPETKFVYRVPPGVARISVWLYIEPTAQNTVSLAAYRDCQPTELRCRRGGDSTYVYLELIRPEAGLMVLAAEGAPAGSNLRIIQTMATACSNGLDDDSDGLVDAADPGCVSNGHSSEVDPDTMPACANGDDDDGDGQIDYPNDPACERAAGAAESDLCVGIHPFRLSTQSAIYGLQPPANEGSLEVSCQERGLVYGAGLLNLAVPSLVDAHLVRGGRFVAGYAAVAGVCDSQDGGNCVSGNAEQTSLLMGELAAGEHQIAFGGTSSQRDLPMQAHVYIEPLTVECNDGVDNDRDGLVDSLDLDCDSPRGRSESGDGALTECSDGIDNDGDGELDYPSDLGCEAAGDDYEATCDESDLWQPVDCRVSEDGNTVFTQDRTLLTENRASRGRALYAGRRDRSTDINIPFSCSLDGQGWVSTDVFEIQSCATDWFAFSTFEAPYRERGHPIAAPCGSQDGRQLRRLVKNPLDCWNYRRDVAMRRP
ncbi:MAG: hypothetical protein ACON3Z_04570 [Bradymonadia bacterium]